MHYILLLSLALLTSTIALPTTLTPTLSPKEEWANIPSTLGLTVWKDSSCSIGGIQIMNVRYNDNTPLADFGSYKLTRFLAKGEHLDFSKWGSVAANKGGPGDASRPPSRAEFVLESSQVFLS